MQCFQSIKDEGNWFIGKVDKEYNPVLNECSLKKKKTGNPQITLNNLTSAFALLLFWICVSFLAFIVELMIYRILEYLISILDTVL